jgi:DNA repair protein RadA/Sms
VVFAVRVKTQEAPERSSATLRVFTLRDRMEPPARRTKSGIQGLDRVLNGGFVYRGIYLLAGEPGGGKSSLALMVSAYVANAGEVVMYCSGEQEESELQDMARRLGARSERLYLAITKSVEEVLLAVEKLQPTVVVIDSINEVNTEDASAGDVAQIRVSAQKLRDAAKDKQSGFTMILVGHVTKDDEIAGPRRLEHLVDTVLVYDVAANGRRFLKVKKHRHGPSGEVVAFDMTNAGLREVPLTSEAMTARLKVPSMGYVVYPSVSSARPMLVEVEARVTRDVQPGVVGDRRFTGLSGDRMPPIIGAMRDDLGIDLTGRSLFVEAISPVGDDLRENAADLAVVAAVMSSALSLTLPPGIVACGQIGVTGAVRNVDRLKERSEAALKAGYKIMLVPNEQGDDVTAGVKAIPVASISQLKAELELLAEMQKPKGRKLV